VLDQCATSRRVLIAGFRSSDTWDIRLPDSDLYVNRSYLDTPRLGVGHLELDLGTHIVGGSARIRLHTATVELNLTLSTGAVTTVTAYVHATRPVMVFELQQLSGNIGLRGGQNGSGWSFFAHKPVSARGETDPRWKPNPDPVCIQAGASGGSCTQRLLAGPETSGWATAWTENPETRQLVLSVANGAPAGIPNPESKMPLALAQDALDAALTNSAEELYSNHIGYWDEFWGRSILSVSDGTFKPPIPPVL